MDYDIKTKETMESVIKWNVGSPIKEGEYIVTRYSPLGKGRTYTQVNYYRNDEWTIKTLDASYVIAWCPLSEIEPYKE